MQCVCFLLLSLTLLLGHSYAQAVPIELVLSANELTAGDQLNVTCNTSSSTAGVDLEINGSPIADVASGRLSFTPDGTVNTWTITSVQREDAGTYQCIAVVGSSTDENSLPQTLIVYFGPIFSYDGQEQMNGASFNVTAIETSSISITCNVTATNPNLTSLTLTKPPAANNVSFDESTGLFTITEVTFGNAGTYTCTADNGETTPTTINFMLMVNSLPSTTPSTTLLPATSMSPLTTPIPQASPTPNSAGNVLVTVAVIIVMLFTTLLLS